MTQAELRNLLIDCLVLWAVPAKVELESDGAAPGAGARDDGGIVLHAPDGDYVVRPAPADLQPVRWFMQTPERAAAGRPARAIPSIVALLSALRNTLGAEGGSRLRVGGG
jgi:hypothetical protein